MKKLTYREMIEIINEHNKKYNITRQYEDKNPLIFVVVFKDKNFKARYSLEERSYEFRSDEKYFLPKMIGNSWYAFCPIDRDYIRIDWTDWEEDYYYLK